MFFSKEITCNDQCPYYCIYQEFALFSMKKMGMTVSIYVRKKILDAGGRGEK